jgi:hypothetical protein
MPIDEMILSGFLGSFREFLADCARKNETSEDVTLMHDALTKLEELGQKHTDFDNYVEEMNRDGLYTKLIEPYQRILQSRA